MKLVVVLLFVMLDKLQCGVLSQYCGELSYEPPSIAGRTIRFLFKPWPTPESGDTVTWGGFGLNDPNWQELVYLQPSNKTKINDTFILDIKPWAGYSMIEINARSEKCQGGSLRTKLEKDCGSTIMIDEPAIRGRNVRFRIKPPSTAGATDQVDWYTGNGDRLDERTSGVNISKSGGEIILDYMSTTDQHSIRVFANTSECAYPATTVPLQENCGSIVYDEPAIKGRYVRFRLKPISSAVSNAPVKWYDNNDGHILPSSGWHNTSQSDGEYILDYKTTSNELSVKVYAYMSECSSPATIVTLQATNINNCGIVYMKPQQFDLGDIVQLTYFPDKAILGNPTSYYVTWKVKNSACPENNGCEVKEKAGVYEFKTATFYGSLEYTLVIKSMDREKNGNYTVQCDNNRNTLPITVQIPVEPSSPVFLEETTTPFCQKCLVGKEDSSYKIKCETHDGTLPVVNISVNGENKNVITDDGYYYTTIRLTDSLHKAPVKCDVMNFALATPLHVKTTLYVAKEPRIPKVHMGELKEGSPVNVSCTSSGGRPAARLSFTDFVSKENLAATDTVRQNVGVSTSVISLNNIDKSWNGKRIICCTNSSIYGELCSGYRVINFKFPPTEVTINQPSPIDTIQEQYTVTIGCSILTFNTDCQHEWRLGGHKFNASVYAGVRDMNGTFTKTFSQNAIVPLRKADNGKLLTCVARCTAFPDSNVKGSWNISVPYEPVVSFGLDSDLVILNTGKSLDVECIVDSNPIAKVEWRKEDDGVTMPTTKCGPDAWCMKLERVTRNQSGVYTCVAKNALSKDISRQLNITVNGTESRQTAENITGEDGGPGGFLVPVIGAAVGIVLLAVLIIVLVRKRRKAKRADGREGDARGSANQEQAGPSGVVVSYATIPENDTYSTPIPKSERPKAGSSKTAQDDDTYAMPLPKSQRTNANTANAKNQSADAPKELIYADLDLEPGSTSGAGDKAKPVVRRDGPETEYVDIDFNKKAAPLPDADEDDTNVYANQ